MSPADLPSQKEGLGMVMWRHIVYDLLKLGIQKAKLASSYIDLAVVTRTFNPRTQD